MMSEVKTNRTSTFSICTFGSFSVFVGDKRVPLPQSKKTRALLAYLALADRPQRRERLCELFWDIPDDPRGSLRWSLSKLRQTFGEMLEAVQNTVSFRAGALSVDYERVQRAASADLRPLCLAELEEIAAIFVGPFLEDLPLPRCPAFEAWRVAHANEAELAELRIRRTLIDRLTGTDPSRALYHAQALLSLNPGDAALAVETEGLMEKARRAAVGMRQSDANSGIETASMPRLSQDIHYCRTSDGVQIAYAIAGEGYPILKCANWMSHLQYEWESPIWRHWMAGLSAHNRLVRYDQRGNGLSDWIAPNVSFETMVSDLECVADAAGLERFALLGISRGASISVAYAVKHPERVSHLILYGGRAKGWRSTGDPGEIARRSAMLTLIRTGWGQDNPAFRKMFASLFIPEGTEEQMEWFSELQRRTISPENAARYQEVAAVVDVTDMLSRVRASTLVSHATGDAVVPFESGRSFATGIPGARFVPLESRNHILLEHEPAFARFLDEVTRFLE